MYLGGSGERVLDPKAVLARGALADAQGIVVAHWKEERSENRESGVEPDVATAVALPPVAAATEMGQTHPCPPQGPPTRGAQSDASHRPSPLVGRM